MPLNIILIVRFLAKNCLFEENRSIVLHYWGKKNISLTKIIQNLLKPFKFT